MPASERSVELLACQGNAVLGHVWGTPVRLSEFQYFFFAGTQEQLWDPVFFARLAYDGFFTITTTQRGESQPLPELQPFYGVVDWGNFNASKHVKKILRKLRRSLVDQGDGTAVDVELATTLDAKNLHLYSNMDQELLYERLDSYQTKSMEATG